MIDNQALVWVKTGHFAGDKPIAESMAIQLTKAYSDDLMQDWYLQCVNNKDIAIFH